MTKTHLRKIIDTVISPSTLDEAFNTLYEPDFKTEYINATRLDHIKKKALCFDYLNSGFEFVSGSLSCTGLQLVFKNHCLERILVNVFYDSSTKQIYNSVLAIPKYTTADYYGKKSINQRANTIRSDKDLQRYLKKIYNKFECPIL